jgi:hypothetical protein
MSAGAAGAVALLLACSAALAAGMAGLSAGASPGPQPPPAVKSVVGITDLSGAGSSFVPPNRPSARPYTSDCHRLIDPAFAGRCVEASGPAGTVAAVLEEERGAFVSQERDLVWRERGDEWQLALVHVRDNPRLPARAWRSDLVPALGGELVIVLPSRKPGFADELDLVNGSGQVSIVRFLDGGFALAPGEDRLVTYTPAGAWWYQLLFGRTGGHWEVFSQQFVPGWAALAQHKGAFSAPGAVPAS